MVHVLKYLQQKTEVQNVIAKLSYKHLFKNCAIFGTFSMKRYGENFAYFNP